MSIKNLSSVSAEDLEAFLDSFDDVLCDCDGVLVKMMLQPIQGATTTHDLLLKMGKTFKIVSNNCAAAVKSWHADLTKFGFNIEIENLVNPLTAIIDYLKTINFTKELFVVGFTSYKNEMREAGLKVAPNLPDRIEETVPAFLELLHDDLNIGGVICDWDMNSNFSSLLKSTLYLERPDVLFMIGGTDDKIPVGSKTVIGPGYFQKVIASFTQREPLCFGKPSGLLNNFIVKKYGLKDPKRTLFIGDSLAQDMIFASRGGYQKLLVLTGITKLKDLEQLTEEETPNYYIESFGDLHQLIRDKLPHLSSLNKL